MRVLVTSSAMTGHFAPLVPWIAALRERGDEVLVVAPPEAAARAAELGVPVAVGGSPDPLELSRLWARFRDAEAVAASVIANREVFGRLNTAALLPAVEHAVRDHRPELVLHEASEYAGPVAAGRADVPHAQVAISAAEVERRSLDLAAPVLAAHGPVADSILAAPYLTSFPAAVDPSPYVDTRRYQEPAPAPRGLPDWWDGSDAPLVYVTFGTVAAQLGDGAFRAAVAALADLPVRVLVTTGVDLDLGPPPDHVRVQRWIDQRDVLAEASLVVCHGGSGTTLGALAAGVPMVVMPMFADQGHNARALAELGAAVLVDPEGHDAGHRTDYDPRLVPLVRAAVTRVLDDHAVRTAARAAADEMRSRPSPIDLLADTLT